MLTGIFPLQENVNEYKRATDKTRRWHKNGERVYVTAYELKEGHPYSQHGDVVAVRIHPADTIFKYLDEYYLLKREDWLKANDRFTDTWKEDEQ